MTWLRTGCISKRYMERHIDMDYDMEDMEDMTRGFYGKDGGIYRSYMIEKLLHDLALGKIGSESGPVGIQKCSKVE